MLNKSPFKIVAALLILLPFNSIFAQDAKLPEPLLFEKELLQHVKTLSRDISVFSTLKIGPGFADGIDIYGFTLKSTSYNPAASEFDFANRINDILIQGWLVAAATQDGPSFTAYPPVNTYYQATVPYLAQTEIKAGTKFLDLRTYLIVGPGFSGLNRFSIPAQQEIKSLGCDMNYSPTSLSSPSSPPQCRALFLEFLNKNDIWVVARMNTAPTTASNSFCKTQDNNLLNGRFLIYNSEVLNKDATVVYGKGYNKTQRSSKDIERIKTYASTPQVVSDVYAEWKLDDDSKTQYSDEFIQWAQTHQFGCGNFQEDKIW